MIIDDKGIKLVDFRQGDIGIGIGNCFKNADTLYFTVLNKNTDYTDVSTKTLPELNAQTALVFPNIEYVNYIIKQLFEIRNTFLPFIEKEEV